MSAKWSSGRSPRGNFRGGVAPLGCSAWAARLERDPGGTRAGWAGGWPELAATEGCRGTGTGGEGWRGGARGTSGGGGA